MIGRIVLYGLAFGSAAAALTYVHYVNGLYAERNAALAISIFAGIMITALASYMFIHSLSHSGEQVKMGKALFGSLFVCLLISGATIMCYGTLLGAKPEIKADLIGQTTIRIEKAVNNDKEIAPEMKEVKIAEMKKQYAENLSPYNFGKSQLQMNLSICMVVSLITFLFQYRNSGV